MQTRLLNLELPSELYFQLQAIPGWEKKLVDTLPELVAAWQPSSSVQRITSPYQLEKAFDRGLIEVFQGCFAEPPYYQYHSAEDVRSYFEEYRLLGILYLAWHDEQVVGFTASLPLTYASIFGAEMKIECQPRKFDREFLLSHLGAEPERIQYVADLGVREDYRYQKIGSNLLQTLLDHFPPETPWVLRVLAELEHTQSFYQKFWFHPLPTVQTVKYLHQDKTYHTNERIILAKSEIYQPKLEVEKSLVKSSAS